MSMSDMKPPTAAELAFRYQYNDQFGFTRTPVTIGDGGVAKLRRFAAALCNVAGADGNTSVEEVAFIIGYCASKGYPSSILDDIPAMCKEAESKSSEDVANETKELLNMGSLRFTSRQIIYDAIRAAEQDGLSREELDAIANVGRGLGVSAEDVESIHQLIKKETALIATRVNVLFPNDSKELFPVSDRIKCLFPQNASAPTDSDSTAYHEPVPIVLISDPGQDLDDEMMFIMSSHLHSLGLISIRGVIANLYPSLARARLARGTLNLLGLHDVPVGIGTDGGDTTGNHSSKQFESTSSSYIIPEDDEAAMKGLETGHRLLQRLYQAAPEIEYADKLEVGTNGKTTKKKEIKGGLTIVVTSSFKDISIFVRDNPKVFASKTREVVVMGGCEPVSADSDECKPDSANNNTFDPEASAHFYSQCQKMNVTLTVVARHSAYAAKMPRSVYDDLALTGSAIGLRLRNSQRAGIDELWQRASSDDPNVRCGLPPRCDRKWFVNTFCAGIDDPSRSGEDSMWDLVSGFMQYDTLALLASIPLVREAYFDPSVLPPLSSSLGGGTNGGGAVAAFDTGTRNLIGLSEKEHSIKEPSMLVQLLKTGYRQGILCDRHNPSRSNEE